METQNPTNKTAWQRAVAGGKALGWYTLAIPATFLSVTSRGDVETLGDKAIEKGAKNLNYALR